MFFLHVFLSFFHEPEERIFLVFLWGDPVQNRPQNPALQVAFSLLERVENKVPERGDFGEENWLGKGGVDRATKKEKRMRETRVGFCLVELPFANANNF